MRLAPLVLVPLLCAGAAHAARYAVVVGSNMGSPPDAPLAFAEADAVRMGDVLTTLADVAPENAVVLRSPSAEAMRRAVVAQNERLRVASVTPDSSDEDSVLVVYYSGHADDAALRLGDTRLALDELSSLVRGSPAKFRVLIVDACRSGVLTTAKGGRPGPPVTVSATGALEAEGFVVLTAAAAGVAAQESRSIGASFFTHHLVSALLGGADGDDDGVVTLEEAYRHAYANTLRDSSTTIAGTQHPTYRYDIRGQGDLVLTRLAKSGAARGRLRLPPAYDFLVLHDGDSGAVAAESRRGSARPLWLRPGRYFVRGRGQRGLLEGDVVVTAGADTVVQESALRRVQYAHLVRKGSDETVTLAHGPRVAYWARTGLTAPDNRCVGAAGGYVLTLRYVSIEPRLSWCQESAKNAVLTTKTHELGLHVRLAHALEVPTPLPFATTLDVGTAAGLSYLRQDFTTRGVAPATNTLAPSFAAFVGAGVELPLGIWLHADVEGRVLLLNTLGADGASALAAPVVAVLSVGAVKYF